MPINPTTFNQLVAIYQAEIDSLIQNLGKFCTLIFENTVTEPIDDNFRDIIRDSADLKPAYKQDDAHPAPVI